jgi:hypothetical protein
MAEVFIEDDAPAARAENDGAEATITISRTSADDVQQRQIVVKLDGQRLGELMFGDSITHPIAPGHHRLVVDNTWNWKTVEFEAGLGEHIEFRTQNRGGRFSWFLQFTFGAGPFYVSIERVR